VNADQSSKSSADDILAVDDEVKILELYDRIVTGMGHRLHQAADADAALALLDEVAPDVVLLDAVLPGGEHFSQKGADDSFTGLQVLREMRVRAPRTRVIMITGFGTITMAVEAMRDGAFDYLTKPVKVAELEQVIESALAARVPSEEMPPPVETAAPRFYDMVGISDAMRSVFDLIRKAAAAADSTVLIEGASGTGKELAARSIHSAGARASEPLVPVDCGAISPSLIESEIFGHVAGAFTGADKNHDGLFRAAGRGTVFLDEIGELSQDVQAKLLRTLQTRRVRPVGSTATYALEARVIAATNRNLSREVQLGQFRRDLFYRLHVIPIYIPPLRDRRDDIPLLIRHFLDHFSEKFGKALRVSPNAMRSLMSYHWPGNVRELENSMERAFALVEGEVIEESDLETLLPFLDGDAAPREPLAAPGGGADKRPLTSLATQEMEAIRSALERTGGNKQEAARLLGISRMTLYRKIKRFGL